MKKNEQGSVTLIVFATVMIILIILAAILTLTTMKNKSQIVETQKLKNVYDADMGMIYQNYSNSVYTNTIGNTVGNTIGNTI